MTIDANQYKKEFRDYYKKTGETATHIFTYSKEQKERVVYLISGKRNVFINEKEYTEMRSRDSENQSYNFKDTIFLAVGRYADVK